MAKFKEIIKSLIPPILLNLLKHKQVRSGGGPFEGIYSDFSQVPGKISYNSKESLNELRVDIKRQLNQYEAREPLPVAHGRSQITNLLPLLVASQNTRSISVLDYGGGAGGTYIDCLVKTSDVDLQYFVFDLKDAMKQGEHAFSKNRQLYKIKFIDNIAEVGNIDIVYFGSVIQYISDYEKILLDVLEKEPRYCFVTDMFLGPHPTYVTAQVNMAGRTIPYLVIQLDEILSLFSSNGYELIYKSTNHQPFHDFNNFPEEYRVKDSCNLLFEKI